MRVRATLVLVLVLAILSATVLGSGLEKKKSKASHKHAAESHEDEVSDVHLKDIKKAEEDMSNAAQVATDLGEDQEAEDKQQAAEPKKLEEFYTPLLGQRLQPLAPMTHLPMLQHPLVQHLTGKRIEPEGETHSLVVSPSYGPTSGGIWVQVMGAGSYHTPNSLQCKLDLVEQFCYSNHYYYSWCYITPKCAGVYPFKCHNGPLKFEGKFAVVAKTPWVTSVYPFSGDTTGGTPVTVRGWNFEPHCPQHLLCKFGEQIVPAKYYTSSSIMCIAPCSDQKGFVSVEVSNDGGMHWSMSGVQYGFVGEPADLTNDECQRYLSPFANNPKH